MKKVGSNIDIPRLMICFDKIGSQTMIPIIRETFVPPYGLSTPPTVSVSGIFCGTIHAGTDHNAWHHPPPYGEVPPCGKIHPYGDVPPYGKIRPYGEVLPYGKISPR